MQISEINDDATLARALERLDVIFGASPGEEDWEERVKLVDLVEAYENLTVHISPPSKKAAIRFRLEQSKC